MAVVIHTRKGKYQYAYEHTREGDKVISRYMYPVNDRGDKIKQCQREVAQPPEQKEVAQHKDEQYYNNEVYAAKQRQYKQWEKDDIKSGASERQAKAQDILKNNKNYNIEYGITKDGNIIKEGFKDSFKADEMATNEHFKMSTYDRKRERLGYYSIAGYKIVQTKKELKPEYKKKLQNYWAKRLNNHNLYNLLRQSNTVIKYA